MDYCGKFTAIIFVLLLSLLPFVTQKPKQEKNNDIEFKSFKDYLNYMNNKTTTPFNYMQPDFLNIEKYPLPSIKDIINSPQQEVGILTKDGDSYNAEFQPSNEESNLINNGIFSESGNEYKNPPSNTPTQLLAPVDFRVSQ